ncbi:glycosyltransferase family 4 protein [Chitinophaga filiformis]|uniref:Glycosyltransferase family 4 protein n=1 Tax=Chitinophaga filiformis TaxID=104663 RepID=A0ABY4IAY7_CHIFI|nr:glycosyltransferase family 1 protein [Chitinophaga filiformis]UPK71951.1 glycosyltransferase family 4 protein [Chitinophaga filiformis]
MRIVLIGNYPKDRQESMERFARMLESGLQQAGHTTEIWRPTVFFGSFFKATSGGMGKWFGYVDKWILFPLVLRLKNAFRPKDTQYHICDHSNAFYLKHLPKQRTIITCHDVLAIRGAKGHADAYCPASSFGKVMQEWILSNLISAKKIACVSQLTLKQLKELAAGKGKDESNWEVIHNGFNGDFAPVAKAESEALLKDFGLSADEPYILHIGSRLQRKNRKMLLDMVHVLGDKYKGKICYAGNEIEESLYAHAVKLGLQDRLVSVKKPPHATLKALYSSCYAFIFPSFSEGFGWPVIEAQACGAAVVASNIEPMPEISGGVALHADPHQPQAFAAEFLKLSDKAIKDAIINQGFVNVKRFSPDIMIKAYLSMYSKN